MAKIAYFRQVICGQVETGPDELGPDILRDGTRVRAYQRKNALGCDHAPHRVKSSRNKLPLLEVAKEYAKDGNAPRTCAGREDLAAALHMNRIDAAPIASMPLADDGHRFCCEFPGPVAR